VFFWPCPCPPLEHLHVEEGKWGRR
jgi:hypothetical protein